MISIPQQVLSEALAAVTRASAKASLMPAFALVRIDANAGGEISLSCFNGESAARAQVYAASSDELSVHVDAQTLKAVVDTLVGEVRLSVVDNALVIQSGSHRTTLRIVEEGLPVIGGETATNLFTLSGLTLRSLARVLPFASSDDSRAALQVLHLTVSEQTIIAQAADGFSAGIVTEKPGEVWQNIVIPLPVNFARLLTALVEDKDTVKARSVDEQRFIFEVTNSESGKNLALATATPGNDFPATQLGQMLQTAQAASLARFKLAKSNLSQTVRMVGAMGTQNTFIKVANGAIKVASAPTDTGQARNILDGQASGSDAKVWISAVFLRRAVDACRAEMDIQIGGEKKPVLVNETNFTAILMPLFIETKDPFAEDDEPIAVSLPAFETASA